MYSMFTFDFLNMTNVTNSQEYAHLSRTKWLKSTLSQLLLLNCIKE